MLSSLIEQLKNEIKASWQKAALLGVLLIVGLYVWIPALLPAAGEGKNQDETERHSSAAKTGSSPPSPSDDKSREDEEGGDAVYRWDELLEEKPLLRSAEIAATGDNPFQLDADQFSPPILFVEDSRPDERPAHTAKPNNLELKSTIVGLGRRAALINSQLYWQGSPVRTETGRYRLAEVHSDHVVLTRHQQRFELKLPEQSRPENIRYQKENPPKQGPQSQR